MRDRALTGPWAGFSFQGGRLVSPEGRAFLPEDLAWLSLTVAIAQEWRTMMAEDRAKAPPVRTAGVVYLRDELRGRRRKKLALQEVAAAERGGTEGQSLRPARKRTGRV
jgi:hypothetical protein